MYYYQQMKRAFLSLLMFFVCTLAFGQSYKLHPLFIYSFTRHVQWPEEYNLGDFEIVVFGDSPIVEELQTMARMKKVGDRSIVVKTIQNITELRKCNILFLPSDRSDRLKDVLQKVGSQSILIVTESSGMGQQGSNINFVIKDGKLAFELNQSAMAKQNLKATPEITRLAIII
jgi:nitrogen regulatory protein PII